MSGYSAKVSAVRIIFFLLVCLVAITPGCKKKDKDDPILPVMQDDLSASFTATPLNGEAPLQVQFYDTSTGDTITDWAWDFDNDGGTDSTDQSPLHTYSNPGWYTVSLTVSNTEDSDTCTKEQYILVANEIFNVNPATTTIQQAIDAASDYDLVIIASGVHAATGNKDIEFGGKKVYLKSAAGAAACVIDCQGSGRGFYFHNKENEDSVVDGFTIQNGSMSEDGGGIYCLNGGNPTITNCVIKNNTTTGGGGGIGLRDSDPIFRSCIIEGNHAGWNGGGFYLRSGARPEIESCTIRNNTSSGSGGGICINSGSPVLTDCILQGNSAKSAGAVNHYSGGSSKFIRCTITGNTATNGDAGAIRFDHVNLGTGEVTDCIITGNAASEEGGGIFLRDQARPPITNCVIAQNTAGTNGGGICSSFFTRARLFTNCVIAYNTADNGGGIYIKDQPDYELEFNNCIIWGNTATTEGNQAYVTSAGLTLFNFCDYSNAAGDIGGSGSITASDCISTNPLFVGAAFGDFHLLPYSPCIDMGENSLVPGGITEDLDGNDRIDGTVDMGAYELEQ